ncbi:redox-sensing transcriptional repressor Rex [Candidatus Aerophobetes bacterium]|mgnify:CR=1 FL=1|uniref:Redox-sensing transcriptional repressor Rex n=1 Tax=Aerophobetes bacterium TaxID=2030807 RepID=A0A662DHJ2_UNCAE|nr:MAG: redox-sensing transcriptional repressor Rex [Candidatus Aerophobetes bacterium]
MTKEKVPESAAVRLSLYLRHLREMREEEMISSEQLAQFIGVSGARVRKDLSYFGQFGTRGKGYIVGKLRKQISKSLGLNRIWNIGLVGVGKLGRALLNYFTFKKSGFYIKAGFDVNPDKIGKKVAGVKIYHPYQMPKIIREQKIQMGIIAVPAGAAQESADLLIISGIKAILNFSPVRVIVPSYVKLRNFDITSQLEVIPYYIINSSRLTLPKGNLSISDD